MHNLRLCCHLLGGSVNPFGAVFTLARSGGDFREAESTSAHSGCLLVHPGFIIVTIRFSKTFA
jgi:hypothetical protein